MLDGMQAYRNEFGDPLPAFELAGPRERIFFNPSETTAAIVTCGGLCPGLNNVIRAITFTLNLYGVNNVLGINYGYAGLIPGKSTELHNIEWVFYIKNSHAGRDSNQ